MHAQEVRPDGNHRQPLETSVDNLQQQALELRNRRQFMLLGHAGTGKTTSLLHLAKRDALQRLHSGAGTIPIYLTLADFDQQDSCILEIQQALRRSGVSPLPDVVQALESGIYTLYLDGYNEVHPQWLPSLTLQLQRFLEAYPLTSVIIASRSTRFTDLPFWCQNEVGRRFPILAFTLQPLREGLMEAFLRHHYRGDVSALMLAVGEQPAVRELLSKPLYLGAFVRTYSDEQGLPETPAVLTEHFLELKYRRETERSKTGFRRDEFTTMMLHYAGALWSDARLGARNPAVSLPQMCSIFRGHPLSQELLKWLDWARSMNVLVQHPASERYLFAHQSYQDHYTATFFNCYNEL
jgi:hypothetical protein